MSQKTAALYGDSQYQKSRAELKSLVETEGVPCALCHEPINTLLPPRHPMSFTADHVEGLADSGNVRGPLQPMHHRCNSRDGGKRGARRRRERLKRYSFHEETPLKDPET